jgi:predicted histone-like DNA-binding protein
MGEIQIQKIQRTVQVKDGDNKRKKVQKTYGKIIYRKTLSLDDMAEHIMKHGSVYTEDVVIGVITKLKSCMQEMLADGHKVKLDGIGTLYPTLTSEGVEDAKDYSPSENVTRVGIAFLADQSRKSMYKARYMRDTVNLSTKLYSELTETSPQPSPNGEGAEQTGGENGNQGGNENQGGGGTTNPPSGGGGGNEND